MKLSRRKFLEKCIMQATAISGGYFLFPSFQITKAHPSPSLSVVAGKSAEKVTRKAIELLGGMSKFVSKGDVVVVKPNIAWDRTPQQAATTNPYVVSSIVKMCFEAGAKKVLVFDRTCNNPRRCYSNSEIEKSALEAGASVQFVKENDFKTMKLPEGVILKSWKFYVPAIEADVLINVPIAKHHSLTRVSLGIKNLMGIIGGNRGEIHNQIAQKIVDIAKFVKPELTIIDAMRILTKNGPTGGNLKDTKWLGMIIAGKEIASVDAFGVTLFGLDPLEQKFLQLAREQGLGEIDPNKINIQKFVVE